MKRWISVSLGLALAMPAWAVYKCAGADGRMVFQDLPCADDRGEKVVVRPAMGHADPVSLDSALRRKAIEAAIAAGKPEVGMTEAQLRKAMGAPSLTNTDNDNGKLKTQWVYNRPTETYLVYVQDGVVTAIQHRPQLQTAVPTAAMPTANTTANAAPSVKVNCPSALEIRNLETSASSRLISESTRQALQAQVRDMRNCGH